jgi:thioredoxin 1
MNLEGIWTTGFVQDVMSKWEIRAMPTFLFIEDGKQIDKIVGANKDELEKRVQYYNSISKSLSTA